MMDASSRDSGFQILQMKPLTGGIGIQQKTDEPDDDDIHLANYNSLLLHDTSNLREVGTNTEEDLLSFKN